MYPKHDVYLRVMKLIKVLILISQKLENDFSADMYYGYAPLFVSPQHSFIMCENTEWLMEWRRMVVIRILADVWKEDMMLAAFSSG